MRHVLMLLVLLAGCSSSPMMSDGGVIDADAGPVPECRPLSENPTCMGDCTGLYPACPVGYALACRTRSTVAWFWNPDGYCELDGADDGPWDICIDGEPPACPGGWVCIPPHQPNSAPIVCGQGCGGWGVGDCWCTRFNRSPC